MGCVNQRQSLASPASLVRHNRDKSITTPRIECQINRLLLRKELHPITGAYSYSLNPIGILPIAGISRDTSEVARVATRVV